jgi:PGF-CTERM protein
VNEHTTRRSATLLALVLVIGTVALPAVAVDEPREEPADTEPPVRIYVSETLDISGIELTGNGESIGTDETTFEAVGGGPSFTVTDPTAADFDGIEPGSYYVATDSDVRAEISVVTPDIDSVELRNEDQSTVTNGSDDPEELNRLSIRARYNFDEVDRLDVTVTDPSGEAVATGRITQSGDRIRVDLGEPTSGVYTVTATGSNVDAASRTVTVRVRGATPTATATATPTVTATPTATPTVTTTSTATPTATVTATGTATPAATATPMPTTSTDGPGFGVLVALLGVFAAAGVARWR